MEFRGTEDMIVHLIVVSPILLGAAAVLFVGIREYFSK